VANIRKLGDDPKNDEFTITNGLKTIGILAIIIGHRVALDLGTPSFNLEFAQHVGKPKMDFYFILLYKRTNLLFYS